MIGCQREASARSQGKNGLVLYEFHASASSKNIFWKLELIRECAHLSTEKILKDYISFIHNISLLEITLIFMHWEMLMFQYIDTMDHHSEEKVNPADVHEIKDRH